MRIGQGVRAVDAQVAHDPYAQASDMEADEQMGSTMAAELKRKINLVQEKLVEKEQEDMIDIKAFLGETFP